MAFRVGGLGQHLSGRQALLMTSASTGGCGAASRWSPHRASACAGTVGPVTRLRLQNNTSSARVRYYGAPGSLVYELEQLAKLHADGGLNDEEFKAAKAAVISDKKKVYFTKSGPDARRGDPGKEKISAPTDSAVDESIKAKKKARSASFNKIGTQAVAMAGLADGAHGETGLGQALAHVARSEQPPQQMPGGGSGFSAQRRGRRRLDDAEREQRIAAATVLRARALENQAERPADELEHLDQRLAAELGMTLTRDGTTDPARTGTYYLRIACRMIGVPGQPMAEVSTNTANRLLEECGLPCASMTTDVPGECVVVLTPPDTSEALVLSTMAAVTKSNGSATFGPKLADPVMYRVEEEVTDGTIK